MKRLVNGETPFAVATVDAYIATGGAVNFPGTIVAVIDESKGGDAIVCRKDFASNIEELKRKQSGKIGFTPSSPSEHLLKAVGAHFDVELLKDTAKSWRVEAKVSSDALKKLLNREVDCAVVWEPDVARALSENGIVKILGTEDTDKLIVDVLLVNRKYSQDKPEVVQAVLANYFRTLKYYNDNPEVLAQEVKKESKLNDAQVKVMLRGVAWANLQENATKWFGVSSAGVGASDGVVDAIDSAVRILVDNGDFRKNPIPNEDPYRITYSDPVKKLFEGGIAEQFGKSVPGGAQAATSTLEKRFAELSPDGWAALREVGSLKVRPITFQSGTTALNNEEKLTLEEAVKNLERYPNFRVLIEGHTGTRGDVALNASLSKERAEAVARYLKITFNVDPNRIFAVGRGSAKPLPRKPGESERTWNYRLPRVELRLMAEVF